MSDYIARGNHRKTIKVIKVLRVKCAPVTGAANDNVMGHNNRCNSNGPFKSI